jgi:hypothetical protein
MIFKCSCEDVFELMARAQASSINFMSLYNHTGQAFARALLRGEFPKYETALKIPFSEMDAHKSDTGLDGILAKWRLYIGK